MVVIAALKGRNRRRIYKRALDLLKNDEICKMYQFDVLHAVERMSDVCDKVNSTIMHKWWCSTNNLQVNNQNSEKNAQEENKLLNLNEEDDCMCTAEN